MQLLKSSTWLEKNLMNCDVISSNIYKWKRTDGSFKNSSKMTAMKTENCVCLLAFLSATCSGYPFLRGKIHITTHL